MAKIRSQGTTLHISNENADSTAYGSATFDKVNGVTEIGEPDGEAQEIDTTDLDSVAKEFLMGIPDNGKFSVSGHVVDDDPGQLECLAARDAQQLRWVKITDVLGNVAYFKAAPLRVNITGASVNGVKPFNASFRISGPITYV